MGDRKPGICDVWAGLECSHVRIGDRWADQLDRTGHAYRVGDLELLASLGVRALRYPVLWGWAPGETEDAWAWADERLGRLGALGIRPVVGLLHHGAGPLAGGFLDEGFVTQFVAYAGEVARRFPWVVDYLPINEPLTNARFGGVSGVWHPHATDAPTFARLLVRQCEGIRAAIRAIRRVNPGSRLLVNDDVGHVYGTSEMASPVDFLNARRWLTFDILTGRVDRSHRLFRFLAVDRPTERALDDLAADPTPPDVIGIDHYVVSDRFIDHRLDRYPPAVHGADGDGPYADAELVRIHPEVLAEADVRHEPFASALRETWERYRLPLVIAEVQLAGEPEDQVAWWRTAWSAAVAARAQGIPVEAVTAWAAMGAWDWDSLLVRDGESYEPGAFDARTDPPRRTALGDAIAETSSGNGDRLDDGVGGWWTRPERALWPLRQKPVTGRTGSSR